MLKICFVLLVVHQLECALNYVCEVLSIGLGVEQILSDCLSDGDVDPD